MKIPNQTRRTALLWSCALIASLQQLNGSAQTLVNRYSFNDKDDGAGNIGAAIADSVGGAAWNGTLPNGGDLTSYPGQLNLSAGSSQYVQFPAGILSNYTAVTIDMWATYGSLPNACFGFAFGYTDSGGGGGNCIFLQPKNGRVAISGGDPSWAAGEQNAYTGSGDLSGQTVHVTAVVNPPLGYIAIYTNGFLAGVNLGETVPLSSVSNTLAYIARSLYTGDSYMDVTVDEYRIWNGGLNPLEVAGQDLAGPNTVSTNYGTVNQFTMSIPSPIAIGAGTKPSITVGTTIIPTAIQLFAADTPISYTSSAPGIATVNPTNGIVTGVASGSANIIASFGGMSATNSVQVISLPTTMIHRYSFNENTTTDGDVVRDSVGTNNGTFYNGSGSSSISGGSLNLNGTSPGDYVDLGSYLISTTNIANNAVTMEGWVTVYPGNGNWTRLWDFGNFQSGGTVGSSSAQNYWSFMPTTATAGLSRTELSQNGNLDVDYTGQSFQGWTNVHVVVVFNPNPSRQFFGLYINGALVNSASTGAKTLSGIDDFYSWLGRSLWSGDSALQGQISEFRIYNGELNRFQIAASDQSGPDTTNFNIGTFVGFRTSLNAPMPILLGLTATAKAYADFTLVTNVLLNGDANLTFTSSDTNIFTVTSAGVVKGTGVGSATLNIKYNYIVGATTNTYTGSAAVSVHNPDAILTHRYAFTNDASDAMNPGGVWDGTTPNSATYANGQIVLDPSQYQYVQLPSGILSNYNAVTIESWVSPSDDTVNQWASFFYGFGNTDSGGAGDYYLFGSLSRNYACLSGADPGYNAEQGVTGFPGWDPGLDGTPTLGTTNLHWVAVYNPPQGTISIYTNGVLEATATGITTQISQTESVLNYIGKSLYNADPPFGGSVDEFRIYNGALTANEIAATQILGPNQPLSTASPHLSAVQSSGNLVLSWPVAAAGFVLKSSSSLTGPWIPATVMQTIVGNVWQVSVPVSGSGSAQFFRLSLPQ